MVSVAGFLGLLRGDVGVTIIGALSMSAILITAFFVHLHVVSYEVDLLDIVVLIAITGMVVDFPARFIIEYASTLGAVDEKQHQGGGSNDCIVDADRDAMRPSSWTAALNSFWARISAVIVPEALRTSNYMQWALY